MKTPPQMRPAVVLGAFFVLAAVSHRSLFAARPESSLRQEYRIDPSKSRMVVETHTMGLSSMFGHDHRIAARDVTGTISFLSGAPETAVLDLGVRADSLVLLDEDVTAADRRSIERTIRRALETTRFRHISFHADAATSEMIAPDVHDVSMNGQLYLHGVRKDVLVTGQVFVAADVLRVKGVCRIRQTDYKIVPVTFANGTVGVADEVTLTFELVAPEAG